MPFITFETQPKSRIWTSLENGLRFHSRPSESLGVEGAAIRRKGTDVQKLAYRMVKILRDMVHGDALTFAIDAG